MGIPSDKYFYLKDGTVVKNLFELSKALEKMPDDVFRHHVNENKNDFYNWVRDIVKDPKLAANVLSAKSSKEMLRYVGEKIKNNVIREVKEVRKTKAEVSKPAVKSEKQQAKPMLEIFDVKAAKTGTVRDKLKNIFLIKEQKTLPKFQNINPNKIEYGIKCPYKRFQCGALEFLFGILLGLLIAFTLLKVF